MKLHNYVWDVNHIISKSHDSSITEIKSFGAWLDDFLSRNNNMSPETNELVNETINMLKRLIQDYQDEYSDAFDEGYKHGQEDGCDC